MNTTYVPYKRIRSVSYYNEIDKVSIAYFEGECTFVLEIPKECMVTTRAGGNSYFCDREGRDKILNLYNQMTMEYMTNHYDKD